MAGISFRVQFDDGAVVGDTDNPAEIAVVQRLAEAREHSHNHLTIGLEGCRTRTVGDIRSIEIDGQVA